jgi:hypothetical protein
MAMRMGRRCKVKALSYESAVAGVLDEKDRGVKGEAPLHDYRLTGQGSETVW